MKILFVVALLGALHPAPPAAGPRHTLMPVPAGLAWGSGRLRLDGRFTAVVHGVPGDARLERGVARFLRRLERTIGVAVGAGTTGLTITVRGKGAAVQGPDEDESYLLDVTDTGATLTAPTTVGALRGLETLLQLVEGDSAGYAVPAVHIADRPRFPWRGLLIDAGRHFQPVETIKRQLDGMAVVKLNVLHWHLSEDQGFRVESRRFPRLQQLGSDGRYYTQEQIREVVAYARDRGIRVVPEFDMPGHSTAWFVAYPEEASSPGPFTIERTFGVFRPAFDPTRESVYRFIDAFIGEMAALFPDPYWHIGGDEVDAAAWKDNPRIRAFMRAHRLADNDALQAYFNRRLSAILTRHRKQMVGWDEILHPGLPTSTVIQSWRGQESLGRGAKEGHLGILSANFYLDHMRTAEFHYLQDPVPAGSLLTAEEARRVLGGEACMWGEHLSPESIDSRIWPRLAAIAERLWSPREVRDVPDMYRRLSVMRGRLEEVGLGSEGHTPRMARQMAGGADPAALAALLSLAEPASLGERARRQALTTLTPLVFAADAARPDPPAQWELRALATAVLARDGGSAEARRVLASRFARWPGLAPALDSLGATAPLARDALPAAQALGRVAAIGTDALEMLGGGPATADWKKERLAQLDSLERPQGLLRLSVIPGVRLLVAGVPVP
jgi:hexosaminidase